MALSVYFRFDWYLVSFVPLLKKLEWLRRQGKQRLLLNVSPQFHTQSECLKKNRQQSAKSKIPKNTRLRGNPKRKGPNQMAKAKPQAHQSNG